MRQLAAGFAHKQLQHPRFDVLQRQAAHAFLQRAHHAFHHRQEGDRHLAVTAHEIQDGVLGQDPDGARFVHDGRRRVGAAGEQADAREDGAGLEQVKQLLAAITGDRPHLNAAAPEQVDGCDGFAFVKEHFALGSRLPARQGGDPGQDVVRHVAEGTGAPQRLPRRFAATRRFHRFTGPPRS